MKSPTMQNAPAILDAFQLPDQGQQEQYLLTVLDGQPPIAAARAVGTNPIGVMLARHADPDFNDACHLVDLAVRENCLHEVVRKAMVATGSIHMVPLRDPDTGETILNDDFEPILAPRLVNGNATILSKLLDKLVSSEDKPGPAAAIQINTAASRPADEGQDEIVRLVWPDAEMIEGEFEQ